MRALPDRYLPPAERKEGWRMYALKAQNMIRQDTRLEAVGPDFVSLPLPAGGWQLVNPETGEVYRWCCDGHPAVLYTPLELGEDFLLRAPLSVPADVKN